MANDNPDQATEPNDSQTNPVDEVLADFHEQLEVLPPADRVELIARRDSLIARRPELARELENRFAARDRNDELRGAVGMGEPLLPSGYRFGDYEKGCIPVINSKKITPREKTSVLNVRADCDRICSGDI